MPQAPARADSDWQTGPSQPHLPEGGVEVWRADLTRADERLDELLSEEERARAARLLSERNRVLWARSRGLLRALLGRYLQEDPRALRFTVDAHGKPRLCETADGPSAGERSGPMSAASVSFNLSHSGGMGLYAFCAGASVGVDVESEERSMDEAAVAARMLGAREAARLRAIPDPAARRRKFLRAWTQYEARLKCLGTGIGASAASVREREVWVAQLEPGAGAAAAVACEREPSALRLWDWV